MNLLNGYSHSNYIKHKSRLLKSNAPCSPLKAGDQYLGFTLALLQKALAAMWLFLHVGESYLSWWCQIQTHTCREQWSACPKAQITIIIPTGMQTGHQTTLAFTLRMFSSSSLGPWFFLSFSCSFLLMLPQFSIATFITTTIVLCLSTTIISGW